MNPSHLSGRVRDDTNLPEGQEVAASLPPGVEPVPDSSAAIDFLDRWNPEGPWVLTAINVDKRGTNTDTFVPDDRAQLQRWLKQHNGQDNIYFHVNPTKTHVKKKASREDIASMAWLHVDVDPRVNEDLEEERRRILNRLTVDLPEGIPKPTAVVYSGGGYQGFWKLEEAFPIDGDPLKYEEAKRYNQQIEILFGADNCHNVDRIMRLPGTVNLPDAGKKKKGRVPVEAKLVYFDQSLVYPLGQFKPAPKQQGGDQGFSSGDTVVISGNIRRLEDIHELDEWSVPDRVKVIIVQGHHPDEVKAGDSSRSAWLFDCLCQLARCDVPPDVMYSIITDFNFGISSSVLDKGGNAEKYAKRQIERAIERIGTIIRISKGDIPEILDAAERALLISESLIFQRGTMLVRPIVLDDGKTEDGIARSAGTLTITEVESAWLVEEFSRCATWVQAAKKNGPPEVIDPPKRIANHYLARVGRWKVRHLNGHIQTPTLRHTDWTVIQEPGYDDVSGLLYEPVGVAFPAIQDHPTREQALQALSVILPLYSKFPFVDEAARSVVLAAVLTAVIRPSLPTAPLFAFDAPTPGTGKSLIAETIGIIATGQVPAMMSQGKSAEEDEKRLGTVLMAGDPVIVIDNCEAPVQGDFLCSVLSQEKVQARVLGKSERVHLPCKSVLIATGNNLSLAGDISRRALLCRLDARQERPDMRQFDFKPREVAKARRAELVVAALTILRAYISAGRPSALPAVGSFEDWNIVREALAWLGCADPANTRERVMQSDPRRAEHIDLLSQWHRCFKDREMLLHEIDEQATICHGNRDIVQLHGLLVGLTNRPRFNAKSIGRNLNRFEGRPMQGKVLRSRDGNSGKYWRVELVGGESVIPEQNVLRLDDDEVF